MKKQKTTTTNRGNRFPINHRANDLKAKRQEDLKVERLIFRSQSLGMF